MNSHLTQKSSRQVSLEWVNDIKDEEARTLFKERLLGDGDVFDKLRSMIQRRYDEELKIKVTDYDTASWAYKQAHSNGRLDALEEIFKLLP